MAVTDEEIGKEQVPKEYDCCGYILGHMVKNYMTVIVRWGAIKIYSIDVVSFKVSLDCF